MSLLLDAVRQSKAAERSPLDPSVIEHLPTRRERSSAWYWLGPVLALFVGAGAAWFYHNPQWLMPKPQWRAAQQVTLPMPQPLVTVESESVTKSSEEQPTYVVTLEETDTEQQSSVALAEVQSTETDSAPQPTPSSESSKSQPQVVVAKAASSPVPEKAEPEPAKPAIRPKPETPSLEPPKPLQSDVMLAVALEKALADLGGELLVENEPEQIITNSEQEKFPTLGQLPWQFQKSLPDLDISAHIYSTDPDERWLRANGRELKEGDEAAPGLFVHKIRPGDVVLEKDQRKFRVPPLGSL